MKAHWVTKLTPNRPNVVTTEQGRITAETVILATNGYIGDLDAKVSARVMPINNYIVATEPLGDAAPLAEDIAANDTRFVVNYWRQTPDKRLLFGGGESYGYRFPDDIAAKVRPALAQVYPQLAKFGSITLGVALWRSPATGCRILRGPHPPYLARRATPATASRCRSWRAGCWPRRSGAPPPGSTCWLVFQPCDSRWRPPHAPPCWHWPCAGIPCATGWGSDVIILP